MTNKIVSLEEYRKELEAEKQRLSRLVWVCNCSEDLEARIREEDELTCDKCNADSSQYSLRVYSTLFNQNKE